MAALNFPSSPSNGDTYTANGVTYVWNGTAWKKNTPSSTVSGITTASGVLNIANDLDVDGHTNLDNVNVSGVSTFSGNSSFAGNNVTMNTSGNPSLNVAGGSRFEVASMENGELDGSITHTGDVTTLIKFPSNNNISLDTAGTTRLNINNSGANITGNLTVSAQPCVQLYTISNVSSFGTSTEATPIQFTDVHINQGGMTLSNSNSRVEVPQSGIYLVNGMASGGNYTTADAGDGVRLQVMRNGSSYPGVKAYGLNTLGSTTNQEFFWSFSILLNLTATDYLELEFENISTNFGGPITRGQFGIYLLS